MEKRYVFRGNAAGAAAHIRSPEEIVWVQGQSSLPVIGGYSQSEIGQYKVSETLQFDAVATKASGDYSEREKAFKTLVSASAKGVSVSKRFTADVLEAMLTSTHPESGGQPTIVPDGTRIEGLRLDGYLVTVKLDLELFGRLGTKDKLADAYSNDEDFYRRYGHRFFSDGVSEERSWGWLSFLFKPRRKLPEMKGYVLCSLAGEVRCEHPQAKVEGNMISLPEFGKIHLAELLITENSRRLTLVRLKLGSPQRGDVCMCEVESNGQGLP